MSVTAEGENHVVWHNLLITQEDRNKMNRHKSGLIWFTGLSGAGKSTIADLLEKRLYDLGIRTYILDGDNIRHGLNSDLGFSREERKENIRRVTEVAKLFCDAGIVVLATFITPFQKDRNFIRKSIREDCFLEVYIKCSIKSCELRDTKGAYKKARAGLIKEFTGISSPYEEPEYPDLIIDTEKLSIDESVALLSQCLIKKNFLR